MKIGCSIFCLIALKYVMPITLYLNLKATYCGGLKVVKRVW